MKFKRFLAVFLLVLLVLPASSGVFADNAPDAPKLSVTQLAGKFTLTWNTPSYNGGTPVTHFRYTYYPTSEEGLKEPKWVKVDAGRTTATTELLDRYQEEYTFRIKAVNESGLESEETVVLADLLHKNHIEISTLCKRLKTTNFTPTIKEAESQGALKAYLEKRIQEINSNVKITVNITEFVEAQLTQGGSFQASVEVSLGNPAEMATYATDIVDLQGNISSSGQLAAPKITLATSEQGGLAYEISTTGTAAQAEYIKSYKISIYDASNNQLALGDYEISAAQKKGVIPLSSDIKGGETYRAQAIACSTDTLKYFNSETGEDSNTAVAGRMAITIRPTNTQKIYGDTEPTFGYEIVKGPVALPTGVALKLTFSRAQGTEVGTYAMTYQQTDTNYEVTVEDAVFEILPRPITIRPTDRELTYSEGTSYLPNEASTAEGLLTGDTVETLEFDPADARSSVGEFEIAPISAVITSGGKDVTKNYDITFEPGKLIIRPVGYDGSGSETETTTIYRFLWFTFEGGFPWLFVLVVVAILLLIAAAVVLIIVLRKRSLAEDGEETEDGEPIPAEDAGEKGDEATAATEGYDEYLEIIDLEEIENTAQDAPEAADEPAEADDTLPEQESFFPPETDSATQATIEEIENAQAKAENEE